MKTVNENYSYDELEGFVDIKPNRQVLRDELIQISLHERALKFSRAALTALGDPEYVSFKVNPDRMLLLVYKSDPQDIKALRLRPTQPQLKLRTVVECQQIKTAIEKLTKHAIDVVNLYADGVKAKTMKDTAIFDLRNARYEQKRNVGKAKKKAQQ